MSRFFAAGYTSDTSSDEDLLSSDENISEISTDSEFALDLEELSDDSDYDVRGPSYFLKKDFLKGAAALDSDLDLDRRVVKSARDKLGDDVAEAIDALTNAYNLENWSLVLTEFDRLQRLLVRAHQQHVQVPNAYYKAVCQLESGVAAVSADRAAKKMPGDQSRAFNTIRQRLKKLAKTLAPYVELYAENPAAFDGDEPVQLDDGLGDTAAPASDRVVSPVFAALKQVAETRGKKNIDKHEQVAALERLAESAQTVFERLCLFQMVVSVRFDAAASQAYMPLKMWAAQFRDIGDLLLLLETNAQTYRLSETAALTDDLDVEPAPDAAGVRHVLGSVLAMVERLDDEFTRLLQNTDPHLLEYIERLKDGAALYRLIVRAQVYVELATGRGEHLARVVLRRLDHIYYKPDQLIAVNEKTAWADTWEGIELENSSLVTRGNEPAEVVAALYEYLRQPENGDYSKHALLAYTYYHAVNSRYAAARDLFLTSQVWGVIATADLAVQVLYNRALVQLGLSAFRAGEIDESHQILNEIANSQRLKELLGQGFNLKYPSQASAAERLRLLPFHMHINLELLECVFMTASLLIEIPALAAAAKPKDARRKASIKSFKSKLEFHDRQYFTGPPESIKDHLIYALRYLQRGSWAKSYELLLSIKIWNLFPDHAALLAMLRRQLQVEGLRTYIFTYKAIFSKLSVATLAQMFELDAATVADIVDRMLAEDIQGSVEAGFINFATDEPQRSKLQELAIVMNEKVGLLNEKNEKTAANGHGRKQAIQQQQQQQKEQKEQKEMLQEENNRFRYANVNTNNDEFQVPV